MQWLKRKLQRWLFPEYCKVCIFVEEMEKVCIFMEEMEKAKQIAISHSEHISIDGPVVLVGSLVNCQVDVKPVLQPRIVLAELQLKNLLDVTGDHQSIVNCYFTGQGETAVDR